jgi:hypothetical protein
MQDAKFFRNKFPKGLIATVFRVSRLNILGS